MDPKTARTIIRTLGFVIAAFIIATAIVAGTYINVRWGGPYTITMTQDDSDASPPPVFPKNEKEAEGGGRI